MNFAEEWNVAEVGGEKKKVDSPSYHVPPQLISDEFHRAPGTVDRRG